MLVLLGRYWYSLCCLVATCCIEYVFRNRFVSIILPTMELTAVDDNSFKMSTPPWQGTETDSSKDPKVERCGIGFWHPSCLEPLRDIRAFIAAMCFVSCLQASYSGYTSSQITTLEKRFAIGSIVIGAVNSFFEVGYISCVMIVSYLGAKGRVPLWIACGLFAMSCGAFLFSTPQFLFPYDSSFSSSSREYLCSADPENQNFSTKSYCKINDHGSYHFFPILLFAQFLIGAGSSPILTLAPPFVDDHVSPSKAPAMIGKSSNSPTQIYLLHFYYYFQHPFMRPLLLGLFLDTLWVP